MTTPLDIENLRAKFIKIMRNHQLSPEDVDRNRRTFYVAEKGTFECRGGNCTNVWHSNFSWVTFDIIDLEIKKRWYMKCRFCFVNSMPKFTVEQLEDMYDRAIIFYKGEYNKPERNIGRSGRRIYTQPHRPDLCEKCCWGTTSEPCWFRRIHG